MYEYNAPLVKTSGDGNKVKMKARFGTEVETRKRKVRLSTEVLKLKMKVCLGTEVETRKKKVRLDAEMEARKRKVRLGTEVETLKMKVRLDAEMETRKRKVRLGVEVLKPKMKVCLGIEVETRKRKARLGAEMHGSIANDLYSESLKSSSVVELDRGSSAVHRDDDLHDKESDSGDLWYDDGSSCEGSVDKSNKTSDMDREWQKRHNQFHTIGYRDGLIAGKEAAAQEGFNIGFKNSVFTGYNLGLVRGITSAMACLHCGLKEKLVETEETRNKFEVLHESVQSLSTTDALKLFYEDQKSKSSNQNENEPSSTMTDLNHESQNVDVLQNYHEQVRSLISESPLVEVQSDIN
ncbi:hypothetical protein BUALT_Bualt01G0158100 [Buddleja alternifolia]|uniref:Essential protein Yae1 N-terminal domain-containing protein n=1 Tax=Buddleja alternifolia TaxID=168488 RepID=A0AAV6YDD0_9LAMI|nr:hypothetical protein BUALT_Bualt01G0158100 [Buddleja alternifolia]